MASPFLGEIKLTSVGFAQKGWAFCNGQVLSIAQNTALFSLIGTTFGGDGVQTFALPNLQGRVPVHPGQGIILGEIGGAQAVTVIDQEIPEHSHGLTAVGATGTTGGPAGNMLAEPSSGAVYGASSGSAVAMAPQSIGTAGGSQPHNNIQPSLTVNFIIALQGIFPSHSQMPIKPITGVVSPSHPIVDPVVSP